MADYSASLSPTLSAIDTYVGRMATVNQQVQFSIGTTGFPSDSFYLNYTPNTSNQYSSAPTATLSSSPAYANYVYMIGLRGDGNGRTVYARIDIQAKMRFRQVCYSYNRGRSGTTVYYYYSVIEGATTRLYTYPVSYQIYAVTDPNYAKPGYLFTGGALKASSATYDNYGGGFAPFGTYTFKTSPLSAGSRYSLFAPNGAEVVRWDNQDASYPYDDSFTQVGFGLCANNATYSPTLDNWTAKDI